MDSTTIRSYRIALVFAALAGTGWGMATAANVREAGTESMDHWYGRAGGLVGSDLMNESAAWRNHGRNVDVGMPANSGSLYFNEAQGGFSSEPHLRAGEDHIGVGMPANSGSLYFNEAQGGFLSKPHMRTDATDQAGQSAASSQQEGAAKDEH